MTSKDLREMYLKFFESKSHAIIPSASLIPENDPTVLFTTAGMHPLVPYLMGEKHPAGTRLTDAQKCVRTGDIEEVGDASHCTFFEMLGNWSLGDYFKKEMIPWSYEFLTSPEYLGFDKERLAVSVFAGDEDAPRDEESAKIWEECGIAKEDIYYLPKENNWWGPAGLTGPCGPDTEMFIKRKPKCGPNCSPACDCGAFLEIWNDVFMEYNKTADGKYELLARQNVDTGMGLERTVCIMQNKESVYDTDIFVPAKAYLEEVSGKSYDADAETTKAFRIILDHLRTATFMIGDEKGIAPSNVDQGYILRRVLRRAIRYAMNLDIPQGKMSEVSKIYAKVYEEQYPELTKNLDRIVSEVDKEEVKFLKTLQSGTKEFNKATSKLVEGDVLDGKTAFRLLDTYGFPIEITIEMANEKGIKVDEEGFKAAFAEHQEKSRAGSEQKFACGLADNKEETTKLHTATHLLHAALREICSKDCYQRGSNITAERLRFDFSFDRALTKDEVKAVEARVNEIIEQDIPVVMEEMTIEEAKERDFLGIFESKYGEVVKTYSVGDFSREICGGPHAARTGELGRFKIKKEQSSSAGVRRIKAVLINE